jgi:hypothetical protein
MHWDWPDCGRINKVCLEVGIRLARDVEIMIQRSSKSASPFEKFPGVVAGGFGLLPIASVVQICTREVVDIASSSGG